MLNKSVDAWVGRDDDGELYIHYTHPTWSVDEGRWESSDTLGYIPEYYALHDLDAGELRRITITIHEK